MSKKSKAKKAAKKAKKEAKKYYKKKTEQAKSHAATDTKRYQEDLTRIINESGIAKTRAMEDYIRNIGNIEANKAADIADIDTYVNTNRGRTQEDLDTSLAKESRRYAIEYDKTNQGLAEAGLTFSERTPEKIIQGENVQNVADIQTAAQRSFQDIANYEASKRRNVELTYGQQTAETEKTKTRTLEDIAADIEKAQVAAGRGTEDVATKLAENLTDYGYQEKDVVSGIQNAYDVQQNYLTNTKEKANVIGV